MKQTELETNYIKVVRQYCFWFNYVSCCL